MSILMKPSSNDFLKDEPKVNSALIPSNGVRRGNRTLDLFLRRETLYLLSYPNINFSVMFPSFNLHQFRTIPCIAAHANSS